MQDVVVSKLKRFSDNDLADILAMIEWGLVDHTHLVKRFNSAADAYSMGAGAHRIPEFVANLNRIERDYLEVPETEYELPPWADA